MRRALVLLLLGGCELVFPLDDEPDTARTCEPGAPFAAGIAVHLDTSDSVEAARFVPDRTSIYVSLCANSEIKASCDL